MALTGSEPISAENLKTFWNGVTRGGVARNQRPHLLRFAPRAR